MMKNQASVSSFTFSVLLTSSVEVADGKYEITIYTSCCNADKGIYYYTTYNCRKINAVDMHRVDLDSDKLFAYNLIDEEDFFFQN